ERAIGRALRAAEEVIVDAAARVEDGLRDARLDGARGAEVEREGDDRLAVGGVRDAHAREAAEARAVGRVPVDALLALLAGVALPAPAGGFGLREARRDAVVAGIGVLAAVAVDVAAEGGDVVVAVLRLLRAVRAVAAPRIGRAH